MKLRSAPLLAICVLLAACGDDEGTPVDIPASNDSTPDMSDDSNGTNATTTPDPGSSANSEPLPASDACAAACANVYGNCEETLFLFYDGNEEGRLGGISEDGCRYMCEKGYFVGQEGCVENAGCNQEAITACFDIDIENPDPTTLDIDANWPESWRKFETQTFALINLHRQIGGLDCGTHGVKPPLHELQLHDGLQRAARAHVLDMALSDFYGHESSDGTSPGARIRSFGYSGSGTGEIINRTFSGWSLKAVAGWVHSDSHCRRMMMPYNFAGVGYARHPSAGEVSTVDFGN